MGLNISSSLIFYFHGSMKNFNRLKKKKKKKEFQIYLSSIKAKVAIKFPKKNFSAENRLGAERVNKEKFYFYEMQTCLLTLTPTSGHLPLADLFCKLDILGEQTDLTGMPQAPSVKEN